MIYNKANINQSFTKEKYYRDRLEVLDSFYKSNETNTLNSLSLSEEKKEELLRDIFDISRKFGLKFLSENKLDYLDIKQFQEILEVLDIPCLSGVWSSDSDKAFSIKRDKCEYKEKALTCLFWREAIDGLTMGLGDSLRYSRHKSRYFSKDKECVDVIYDSNKINLRWDKVPEDISIKFQPLIEKLNTKQVELNFIGYAEKTIYYKIKDSNENLSGFRRKFLIETIEKFCSEKVPEINLFEISPRAVIEGEF
ncbi:MAG: hypothetical protein U0354_06005 [Candidatus Sericytochromatia bacterium]